MIGKIWRIIIYGWPLMLAAFFIPFGSDWVAAYVITAGIRGPLFFLWPCLAATSDIIFWNWFFGWGKQRITSAGKVKEAIEEFSDEGLPLEVRYEAKQAKILVLRIWGWLTNYIEENMSPGSGWKLRVLNKIVSITHNCPPAIAYIVISFIPVIPAIGMYIGIIVCRTVKLRFAFLVLLLANLTKTLLIMVLAYAAFN